MVVLRGSGQQDNVTTWVLSRLLSSGRRSDHVAADLRCLRCSTRTGIQVNRTTSVGLTGNREMCLRKFPRSAWSSFVGGDTGGTMVSVNFRRAPSAKWIKTNWTSNITWDMLREMRQN